MKSKRKSVLIDADLHKRLREYSAATGIPIARIVSRGLTDWLDTVGHQQLAALTKKSAE